MIDRDHDRQPEFAQVLDMAGEVGDAFFDRLDVFRAERVARDAAVHFQRAHGGDDDRAGRRQAGGTALDVDEFFRAQIGAEAGLGHHDIGQFQREPGRHHGVAAVRDVGEGAAVHHGGRALQRLHQVRRQRVTQQHRHRAVGLDVGSRDIRAVALLRDDHLAKPGLQIGHVLGQTEHRHHLGGDGDVEPVLAREPVGHTAQTANDRAQRTIVHVEAAPPGNPPRIDAERIAPVHMVIDHRGEQIVGRGDRVEIAGEMQIDLIHRHDLRITATRRAAFHAEAGAQLKVRANRWWRACRCG